MKNILLNTFRGKTPDEFAKELKAVTDHFGDDINVKRLAIQLSVLSSVCSGNQSANVKDVIYKLKNMGEAKEMFTEICKLIRLLLAIPVSSATAERSFLADVNSRSRSLYAIADPSCLSSVCLSVTLVHPTQPVKIFGNFSSPYDSPGTLVF